MPRQQCRTWHQIVALVMIVCLGLAGAREGALCPMTGRPMAEHMAMHDAAHEASQSMDDCAEMMSASKDSQSDLANTHITSSGTDHTTSSNSTDWSTCCAGYSMPIGIPATQLTLDVVRADPTIPQTSIPMLKTRVFPPDPPPPKAAHSILNRSIHTVT